MPDQPTPHRHPGKAGNQNGRKSGWYSRQRPVPLAELLAAAKAALVAKDPPALRRVARALGEREGDEAERMEHRGRARALRALAAEIEAAQRRQAARQAVAGWLRGDIAGDPPSRPDPFSPDGDPA
jgi:hypothetical protein